MKKLGILVLAGLLLTSCGGGGGGGASSGASAQKLDVKVGGKDSTLDAKTSAAYYSAMAFTAPNKPDVKVSLHKIYISNFEMETTGPAWMNKPLTAPDQMMVELDLTGEDGTNEKTPFKVGTYSAQADKVNGVRTVIINTFADGKQTKTMFDSLMTSGNKKAEGEVKITSVTADTVSGEVNLSEGDKSIKGAFTATLPKAK